MESATRAETLNEVVYALFCNNIFEKDMNLAVLPKAIGKY